MTYSQDNLECGVLYMKGFVYGIPYIKIRESLLKAIEIINTHNIRILAWDGDKCLLPDPEKCDHTSSFTKIIEILLLIFPHLKCIFFKKKDNAGGLINGVGEFTQDQYNNWLGPFPFLNDENTLIIPSNETISKESFHYGVEFENVAKWYYLGLLGYKWIKNKLNIDNIHVLISGFGSVVEHENKNIELNPTEYPKRNITVVYITR